MFSPSTQASFTPVLCKAPWITPADHPGTAICPLSNCQPGPARLLVCVKNHLYCHLSGFVSFLQLFSEINTAISSLVTV